MSSNKYNAKGNTSALFVRKLLKGECDCFYDNKPEYYTERDNVYIKTSYIKYPVSMVEVNFADRLQVCKWYRFLPLPKSNLEQMLFQRVDDRFHELGGYTVEISKEIGTGEKVVWTQWTQI